MTGPVTVDANILLLLVVGLADPRLIASHKRLGAFTGSDFQVLSRIISGFSDLIFVPHVLAEVSNLARQIPGPARQLILTKFKKLVQTSTEVSVPSAGAVERSDFVYLGLTDTVLLQLFLSGWGDAVPTLLMVDGPLTSRARTLGHPVINYWEYLTVS